MVKLAPIVRLALIEAGVEVAITPPQHNQNVEKYPTDQKESKGEHQPSDACQSQRQQCFHSSPIPSSAKQRTAEVIQLNTKVYIYIYIKTYMIFV